MKPFTCLFQGFLVSYRKHHQQNAILLHPPPSDLSSVPNITSHVFWMRIKRRFLFFLSLSFELMWKSTSLLSTMKKNVQETIGLCGKIQAPASIQHVLKDFPSISSPQALSCYTEYTGCLPGLVVFLPLIVISDVFT